MGEMRARPRHGFMLLEVMVAIIIIGAAAVALMKGYIVSLDSLTKIRRNEQSILLARSFMDDLMVEPPGEDGMEGSFADDPRFGEAFAGWKWQLDVEAFEVDYDERPKGVLFQDTEYLYQAHLRIYFDDGERQETYFEQDQFLMDPDLFTQPALQQNQLF